MTPLALLIVAAMALLLYAPILSLDEARKSKLEQAKAILEKAEASGADLSAEEEAQVKTLREEAKDLKARSERQKNRAQELAEIATDIAGVSSDPGRRPLAGAAAPITTREAFLDDPKRGYKSHREQLIEVMEVGMGLRKPSAKLLSLQAPIQPRQTAGSDEAGAYADPYGGFLLAEGFSPALLSIAPEGDPTAGTRMIPMSTQVLEIPARVDKNHASSVSGGLVVYRRSETQSVTATRMEFERVRLEATALMGVSYATEEILARSPISFVALLEAGFRDEFGAKLIDERINGTGVGQYRGVMKSPALVTVAKETGQGATTLIWENIKKMRARCWRYASAVWLANHDCLSELMELKQTVGVGGVPIWQPSAREDRPDTLLGRPILFTEYCQTLGALGDIILVVWSEYLEGVLTPLQGAESIHVRFLNHERTFKFWTENAGDCWWRTALTPKNSTATLSPIVALAARS